MKYDEKYCLDILEKLIAVDSTTGQYEEVQALICKELEAFGCAFEATRKGGVIARLGSGGEPLCVTGHFDDIGLMVRQVRSDGTLGVCPIGGLVPLNCVGENVRIYTREGKVVTGTLCRVPGSTHVADSAINEEVGDFKKNMAIVLDHDVKTAADTRALGLETGDVVALEPRYTVSNGYIKSRFIDDKAAVAIMLAMIKAYRESGAEPARKVYFYFSAYEEIGHGTSWLPADVKDLIAVDIAPTGPKQNSDEKKVTIFAADARIPYHWSLTNELRAAAIAAEVPYVMDIFTPRYGTDCGASINAGYDLRFAAIGFGTANSHGYERTHIEGLRATYDLLAAYLKS